MNISNKIKKAKAVEMLKELDIYKPYIDGVKKKITYVILKDMQVIGHIKMKN